MRLIDKDKTLEELNGGYEQALGIIEDYRYYNINDIEDAIDVVKYADEIDISKHDSELLDKVARKFIEWDSKVKGTREDGVCFFTIENILKGIEELKEEVKQ